MSKAKTIAKKAGKGILVIVLITLYFVVLGYFLQRYLACSGVMDSRGYEYTNGKSNTKYVPKDLNSLIDNIDGFVKEIEPIEGGQNVQDRGNNIK